jgi:hypothetical protein
LDYEIDQSYLNWAIREPPVLPSDDIRRNFVFDEARYLNAVVSPWFIEIIGELLNSIPIPYKFIGIDPRSNAPFIMLLKF